MTGGGDDWFHGPTVARGAISGVYPTDGEVLRGLQDAANENPQLARYELVGRSHERRDIGALIVQREGVDPKATVFIAGMTQPREILSTMTVLALARELLSKGSNAGGGIDTSALVESILSTTRIILLPIQNPDGFEAVRVQFDLLRDEVAKNVRHSCAPNVTESGVNLGHNWGYRWDAVPRVGDVSIAHGFDDGCDKNFRGTAAFSEEETVAVSEFINRYRPIKAAAFIHSRGKSETSRIIVPYTYHKSNLSNHREDKKNRLISKSDLEAFAKITTTMDDSAGADMSYTVGTAWELMDRTIPGSEIDWAFDQAGAFSIIIQVGTANNTYWPADPASIVSQHILPLLNFINLARDLPAKSTPRGTAYHVANTIPIFLGLVLLGVLAAGYFVARYILRYDDVVGRFRTWAERIHRRWIARVGYRGVPTAIKVPGADDDDDAFLELHEGVDTRDDADAHSLDLDRELGLDPQPVSVGRVGRGARPAHHDDDEDDDGVGFSYR